MANQVSEATELTSEGQPPALCFSWLGWQPRPPAAQSLLPTLTYLGWHGHRQAARLDRGAFLTHGPTALASQMSPLPTQPLGARQILLHPHTVLPCLWHLLKQPEDPTVLPPFPKEATAPIGWKVTLTHSLLSLLWGVVPGQTGVHPGPGVAG